jgi:hypothetical protein
VVVDGGLDVAAVDVAAVDGAGNDDWSDAGIGAAVGDEGGGGDFFAGDALALVPIAVFASDGDESDGDESDGDESDGDDDNDDDETLAAAAPPWSLFSAVVATAAVVREPEAPETSSASAVPASAEDELTTGRIRSPRLLRYARPSRLASRSRSGLPHLRRERCTMSLTSYIRFFI